MQGEKDYGWKKEEAQELARAIKAADTWDLYQLEKLCDLAGMTEEWKQADGDEFETVAEEAAEKLGVEII